MRHNNVALMAVSKEPNPTRFQKTLAMNDWYLGADDFDFPLGGMQMLGKSDEEEIRAQAPRWAGRVSPDLPFEVLAHHAVDFWLCGEDLPQPDNRVTVDAEGAIHLSLDEKNNVEGVERLRHKLDGMLSHLGMETTICSTAASTCTRACRSVRRRTRQARSGSAPTRLECPGRELQGARCGQPVRGGHELLPQHRSRGPVPDGDRERPPGR